MRPLLLVALLAPCIALGAPRKVTVSPREQAVQQTAKEKAQPGDDRPAQGVKTSVDGAAAANHAKAKPASTTAAPARQ